jgi:hypothetical protein
MHRQVILLLSAFSAALFGEPSPWGVQRIQQTGIGTVGIDQLAVSPDGSIYLAVRSPQPMLRKVSASGQAIFSTPLAGVSSFESVLVSPDGAVYVSGDATAGFATTAGAYETTASADTGFLCKLNSADGHVVYCTYVDMVFPGLSGLSADAQGNAYLASDYCFGDSVPGCIEKINSAGTARAYEIPLTKLGAHHSYSIAADASSDLYVICSGPQGELLVKLDSAGLVLASTEAADVAGSVELDPQGNPQVVTSTGVRRYRADLSGVVFDTPVSGVIAIGAIGSDGSTVLFGATRSANLSLLHPNASCDLPTGPE